CLAVRDGRSPRSAVNDRPKTKKVRAGFSLTRIGFAPAVPERTQRSFTEASRRRMFALEHLADSNPTGIVSASPGLRGTSYPGEMSRMPDNPNGVVAFPRSSAATPFGLCKMFDATQGSSFAVTLGSETE